MQLKIAAQNSIIVRRTIDATEVCDNAVTPVIFLLSLHLFLSLEEKENLNSPLEDVENTRSPLEHQYNIAQVVGTFDSCCYICNISTCFTNN
jgi:hypothetical protein